MSREASTIAVVVVLVLFGGMVLLLGGLAGSATTTSESVVFDPPTAGGPGIVYGHHETAGLSLFGLQLHARERWLTVGLVAPSECIEREDDGSEAVAGLGGVRVAPGLGGGGRRRRDGAGACRG